MNTAVSLVAAFGGGVASFASPCVVPLIPAYLSLVGGLDVGLDSVSPVGAPVVARVAAGAGVERRTDGSPQSSTNETGNDRKTQRTQRGRARWRLGALTRDTALFVAGFATVFVILGASASAIGRAAIHHQALLTRISGILVVAMATFLLGSLVLRTPRLYREWRLQGRLSRVGPLAAPLAGAAFAFGWTPCVGPILASVLALSADQSHVAQGVVLLAAYSLGIGVPFLLVAALFDHMSAPLLWLRRHGAVVTVVSSCALGALGILLVLDRLAWITSLFQQVV